MAKQLTLFILFCTCCFFTKGQSIPDCTIQTINGDTIGLSRYHGKKLMVIVLPVSHAPKDSVTLLNLDNAYNEYKDGIAFIGVPSYEDGYRDSLSTEIISWYRNTLHLAFTITTGMFTRNSSGDQQSAIFKWLTNEVLNGHFGTTINTYGQKFLFNKDGELKAVFDPETPLSHNLMEIIIRM